MPETRPPIYRVADTIVDVAQNSLRRDGRELHLRHKAFRTLLYLIEHADRVVTKEELFREVWDSVAVTDGALVQSIREIRIALGDDPQHPQFVRTVAKVGYQLIGQVSRIDGLESPPRDVAIPELERAALTSRRSEAPASRRSRWPIVAAAAMVLAIVAMVWLARDRLGLGGDDVPAMPIVAVVPFNNLTSDRDLDWLREGLPDMLITGLARSRGLSVLSRSELRQVLQRMGHAAGSAMTLDVAVEAARRGHANVVILGSVSRLGDVIRIDVQVHDAKGTLVSAESLTAPTERLLSDVDVLAIKVASGLGVRPDDRRQVGVAAVMTDNIEAYRAYSLAVEKANAFDSTGALALLEHAVSLDPKFAMAHARIGYTYTAVRVNEDARALPYFEKAFALSDRLSEKDRLFVDAWYSLAKNEDEEYVTKLRRILDRYPLETEAYWRLGLHLAYLTRLEESLAVCERGLALDPGAKQIWNSIGFSYNLLGKYDRAIAAHERYVALDPREPNAHDSLGMTYSQAGRFDDALATFDRALALRPDFHFAVVHKGDVLFMLGRWREALQQYQKYIELAPSDWDRAMGYNHMAIVHWRRGDLTLAAAAARQERVFKNDFGTSLQLAAAQKDMAAVRMLERRYFGDGPLLVGSMITPRSPHHLKGVVEMAANRPSEALGFFNRALAIPHLQWGINSIEDARAIAYLEMGRVDEAIAEYVRLTRLNPSDALTEYGLGRAYQRKGLDREAADAFRRFLELWKSADADLPPVRYAQRFATKVR